MDIRLGAFVVPDGERPQTAIEQVLAAERAGLDLVGIQDHPYQRRHLDTWTLLSFLAARTERLLLAPDVANLPLRPAAPLAKAAATLDVLSNGRVELGLGAGAFWDSIVAMGGPRRSPGQSVEALAEAIDVMRLVWSGERAVAYEGRHYRLRGLHPGPAPRHRIEIWLGAYGPRMLRLTGRKADGWLPSLPRLPPDELGACSDAVDEAARRAGRDPAEVRRLANVNGSIVPERSGEWLRGPVRHWVDELRRLVEQYGTTSFLLWSPEEPLEQIRRFGEEVAPALREALAGFERPARWANA